jgi:hypothetical protein
MQRFQLLLMTCLLLPLFIAPSQAAIMSGDDSVFGVDSIVIDTVNQMEWLDLSQSTSRSFGDVASHFGAGGDYEGWGHATSADLTTFFTEAGFPPNFTAPSSSSVMQTLIGFLGITFSQSDGLSGDIILSEGYYDDGDGAPVGFAGLRNRTGGSNTGPQHDAFLTPDFSAGGASSQAGNWLVRSVPEPTSLSLLGLGGLALLGARRRRNGLSGP